MAIPPIYDYAERFAEGLAYTPDGYIDKTGKLVIPAKGQVTNFYSGQIFSEGIAFVRISSNPFCKSDYGYLFPTGGVDCLRDGENVINIENAQPYSNSRAGIKVNGKWGFMNEKRQIVIEPKYDEVQPFLKGTDLTSVKLGAVIKCIDKQGHEISPKF